MADNKGFNALPMKLKIALLALCPVLIIALCSGVILLYAGSMVEEGIYTPPAEQAILLSAVPATESEKLSALSTLLNAAQTSGETQITAENTIDLTNLTGDLNDAQKNLLQFASGKIESGINAMIESDGLSYGETASLFTVPTEAETTLATDTEDGTFIYTVRSASSFKEDDLALFEAAEEEFATVLTVDSKTVTPIDSFAAYTLDPTTDRLQRVTYTRCYRLEYTVTFKGELAELGTKTLAFDGTLTRTYNITWAGVFAEQTQIILNKNGYEALSLTVNKADDADAESYSLTFTSSDPSVASVDESGVIEAVSLSETPVTVTVIFKYADKTYADTCEVLVINEPESVQMNSKAQTLQIGERVQLDAEVKPAKATVKTLLWYSPDERIATVDENGLVTAVGEGEVQIIAVSEIGTYMAGCNITVEGGASYGR